MPLPWTESDRDHDHDHNPAKPRSVASDTAAGMSVVPLPATGQVAASLPGPEAARFPSTATCSAATLDSVVIETPRLAMRYLRADDVDALMPILGDANVTRYLSYTPWTSEEDGRSWCDEFAETNRIGSTAWFVCIDKASGRMIGNCVLFDREPACARAELGYMIGRAHWRQGFAHEAASATIRHGFERCALMRIEAQIHVANVASQQLAIKLGFQREGLLRKRLVNGDGVLHDVFMFGLLRAEAR